MKTFRFQVYLKPTNQEEYEACEYLQSKKRQKSELILRLLVESLKEEKELQDKVDNIEKVVNNIQELIENNNICIKDVEDIEEDVIENHEPLNETINKEEIIDFIDTSCEIKDRELKNLYEEKDENKEEKPLEDKEKQDIKEGLDMFLSSI